MLSAEAVEIKRMLTTFIKKLKADSISVSSHKIYGPKGVGMVYMNSSSSWKPIYHKATHEKGFRPGTVNTTGIAAFTAAAECAYAEMMFPEKLWPEYTVEDYQQALATFQNRERRFGGRISS